MTTQTTDDVKSGELLNNLVHYRLQKELVKTISRYANTHFCK